jgi:hypothetical protein
MVGGHVVNSLGLGNDSFCFSKAIDFKWHNYFNALGAVFLEND